MAQDTFEDADVQAELCRHVGRIGVRELARELGFSPAFISHVATGKRKLTEKLANKLGFILVLKPSRVWRKQEAE